MSNPVVVRNGVSKELKEQAFGKKSPNVGKKFFSPEFTEATWDQDVLWLGLDNVIGPVARATRAIFGAIAVDPENLNADGTVNMAAMEADWADFTAGQAKLSEIEEQLEELYALQDSYVQSENFGATTSINGEDVKTEEALAIEKAMQEVSKKIKPLKAKKAAISAIYAERATKRKAAAEANKALKGA